MLYQFVQNHAASISLCTFAVTCDRICLKWTSFEYLNNSFIVMLIVLLWMVADFENATSEVQREKQTENWNIFSVFLHLLLPVAGLAVFLKQKHIFSRFLLQLDRNCVSVLCPSFSKREKLLKWAGGRLPQTWSSQSRTLSGGISVLWTDGSLLCTLINSAIPGACLNPHKHWRKPPLHAQAIAYKYLGVVPIFTEKDLSREMTITLERKFLHYLYEIQQAILRLAERNDVSKTTSALYIARGMGLYTGEQHRKTVFYVYPNTKPTICNNSNIIIHIRGPYGTYGKAIIPKFHNDLFTTNEMKLPPELLMTKSLLQKSVAKRRNPFMKNFSLPFMHYHKKHMGDNIVIHVTMEDERAKVTYIPKNYGMYEIIMISNGELIRGCPFDVNILNNTSGVQETLESEEKEEQVPHARKRKVISKTIDFIDEQMPMPVLRKRYKNNAVTTYASSDSREVVGEVANQKHLLDDVEKVKHDNQVNLDPEEKINITNNVSTPTHEQESFKMHQNDTKIDEEDEIMSQDEADNNNATIFSKTENENMTDSVLEKQNVESVNENQKIKCQLPYKQNSGVSNENKDNKEEISTIRCYGDAENIDNTINNNFLENKNVTIYNEGDNETVDNQTYKEYRHNFGNQKAKLTINEYPKPIVVNKIHIPEKFCEFQKLSGKSGVDGLDAKHFKNIINSSSRKHIPRQFQSSTILQYEPIEVDTRHSTKTVEYFPILEHKTLLNQIDDNDSGNDTISSLEDNEVKLNLVKALSRPDSVADFEKVNAVPKRFFKAHESSKINSTPLSPTSKRQSSTSPICSDHIAPEVNSEFRQMSVAERRKIFAQQTAKSVSHSTNSSFSDHENVEVLTPRRFQQFEGLSVLNFLGSLKETESFRKSQNYELSSTKSLPNIPSVETDYIFHNFVKERKNFWEKLSSSSSSLNVNTRSSLRRKPKKMTEDERLRLIWKKPNESEVNNNTILERIDLEKGSEICKSADDILSISNRVSHYSPKKYQSLDNSLDNCTVLSINERMKMLLKQNYEKEKIEKRNVGTLKTNRNLNMSYLNKRNVTKETNEIRNDDIVFSPISDKIQMYFKACDLDKSVEEVNVKEKSNNVNTDGNKKNMSKNIDVPKSENIKECKEALSKSQEDGVKSHFRSAIKYFKNLEEKSLAKSKTKFGKRDCRRHPLDTQSNKFKNKRKGGSLNLPKVSERFSINNVYADVFGSRKGSFKGAVNRSALVDALATFSRKDQVKIPEVNLDDIADIKYDIFKKRAKTKKRKSVRTIFDVYY